MGWEAMILDAVIALRTSPLNTAFSLITILGSASFGTTLAIALYIKEKELGFLLISSIITSSLITYPAKFLISRPRPSENLRLVSAFSENSFPSGHSAMAFVIATFLARKTDIGGYVLYPIAGLVAFSRLYLGVHYPLDILAGSIIGYLAARFVLKHEEQILNIHRKLVKIVVPSGGCSNGSG